VTRRKGDESGSTGPGMTSPDTHKFRRTKGVDDSGRYVSTGRDMMQEIVISCTASPRSRRVGRSSRYLFSHTRKRKNNQLIYFIFQHIISIQYLFTSTSPSHANHHPRHSGPVALVSRHRNIFRAGNPATLSRQPTYRFPSSEATER